ncbi:uncharacterized protein LOC108914288 [Anoplophora glabripennis]|uniref:uncharacterized protein LOC108914288 n=1 Tax=Anoplophora glabripennis TaxID=217634 RepID=UPI000875900B|nr:uncharacterized protein LOC108914288 [Anoplophora glabripennis]
MNDINLDGLSQINKKSTMEPIADSDIPQWKKDLIARLRSQNRTATVAGSGSDQQLSVSPQHSSSDRAGQQPSSTCKSESVTSGVSCPLASEQCNVISTTCSLPKQHKMVQERVWVDGKHDPFAEAMNDNYGNNGYHKDSDEDSDSSEDLHYGPGIVNKLKNKYLSLALRESNVRPSILHMRKATSLENLLDDNVPNGTGRGRQFRSRLNGNDTDKNVPNRYRNAARGEMKRARSVEAISRFDHHVPLITEVRPNRQSLHEEMLIAAEKEGNDHLHRKMMLDNQLEANIENKFNSNNVGTRVNRPKRIQPIMNEKEKPPADVVKQAKMIFERRPEQRTKAPPQTGDVAAKVDSFNNIIVKNKVEAKTVSKKPPIKHAKPVLNDKTKSNTRPMAKPVVVSEEVLKSPNQLNSPPRSLELNKVPKKDFKDELPLPSPIPDVSRIDFHNKGENERGKNGSSLSETPDLILTSSPLPAVTSPTYNKKNLTENFLREEILSSSPLLPRSPLLSPTNRPTSPLLSPSRLRPVSPLLSPRKSPSPTNLKPTVLNYDADDSDGPSKKLSPTPHGTAVFNFTHQTVNQSHLPVNKNVSNTKTPATQPLKIEINGHNEAKTTTSSSTRLLQAQPPRSPPKFSPPPPPKIEEAVEKPAMSLTVTEIEKNLINTVKTLQQPNKGSVLCVSASVEVVNRSIVATKKGRPREPASNTAVFNFTNRKDVPDYISNDRSRSPGRPELPKPGEGGIILIPGATIGDSFTDEDEEILRSLEGPPSPCDVIFVNDNILIDGKSSLSQKTKRTKLRISFIEAGPEIYEYPSETSLLVDDSPHSPAQAQVGHTVPILGGSSLANYTPKGREDFLPGVTRSVQPSIPAKPDITEVDAGSELIIEEIDKPFSSGTNADILF